MTTTATTPTKKGRGMPIPLADEVPAGCGGLLSRPRQGVQVRNLAVAEAAQEMPRDGAVIESRGFCLFYGAKVGVRNIDMDIHPRDATRIGSSGLIPS